MCSWKYTYKVQWCYMACQMISCHRAAESSKHVYMLTILSYSQQYAGLGRVACTGRCNVVTDTCI